VEKKGEKVKESGTAKMYKSTGNVKELGRSIGADNDAKKALKGREERGQDGPKKALEVNALDRTEGVRQSEGPREISERALRPRRISREERKKIGGKK